MGKYRVIYEVEEIRGTCPIYKIGDKIVIDPKFPTEIINLKESTAVCLRVLDNIDFNLIYAAAPDNVVEHLGVKTGECRIACPMPGPPYTPCGYVIFRVKREGVE